MEHGLRDSFNEFEYAQKHKMTKEERLKMRKIKLKRMIEYDKSLCTDDVKIMDEENKKEIKEYFHGFVIEATSTSEIERMVNDKDY